MRFVPSIAGRMAVFATATLFLSASASFAAGDPAAGQHVFAKCAACHSTSPRVNKLGPSLNPAGLVHGTKMFISVPSSTDREDVIAYLDTQK